MSTETSGYWVQLLEYDDITGFVGLKEITHAKWFKSLKGIAQEGDIEVMQVLAVSQDDIDLSRRYITDSVKERTMARYKMWKRVYDYIEHRVADCNRQVILDNVLYPYIQDTHSSKVECSSDEEDDNRRSVQNVPNLQQWIENQPEERSHVIKSHMNDIICISNLLKKPVEITHHSSHIKLQQLMQLKISALNTSLDLIRKAFPLVRITTHNTKTCTFQLDTKERMSSATFSQIVIDINNYVANAISKMLMCDESILSEDPQKSSPVHEEDCGVNKDQPIVNIGIVGHVAHGKTTLIEALSGVDTRKYKKEVATNRTLNIGYTNATICKCQCSEDRSTVYYPLKDLPSACTCDRILVSIVDCPGHNVLLPTMITGAHVMNTCMLVISSDEPCPQPQTNEHVAVLQIIGQTENQFSDGIIIQNKIDLVSDERCSQSLQEIREFTRDTVLSGLPIIPLSAQLKIGIQPVLKFMYEYAARIRDERSGDKEKITMGEKSNADTRLPKGIIVRTFDINKPGKEVVQGTVIGGSIINGTFSINDTIVIVPIGIEARVLSIKTEETDLNTAHVGGLIAIQTDLNPSYCNLIYGNAFIKKEHFDPARILQAGSNLKIKYHLLQNCNKIKKGALLTLNYSGCNIPCQVEKTSTDKWRIVVTIKRSLYVFPNENFTFSMIYNKRLVGCGRCTDYPKVDMPAGRRNLIQFDDYTSMLTSFNEALHAWKESSIRKIKLPVPRIQYKNTFTTIANFPALCERLCVSGNELGAYICSELGMRNWSLTGTKQLMLKGRTDERKVISVLHHYIKDKRCVVCKQNTITTVKNMGVKQNVCTNCTWKG